MDRDGSVINNGAVFGKPSPDKRCVGIGGNFTRYFVFAICCAIRIGAGIIQLKFLRKR